MNNKIRYKSMIRSSPNAQFFRALRGQRHQYKYEPYELPFEIKGKQVFAEVNGEWCKVGRLKRNADLDGLQVLFLYPNEYKYITEDSIEREKGDHYFGIEVTKTVTL